MRRGEASALRWADVADAADVDGVLVTVRRGKMFRSTWSCSGRVVVPVEMSLRRFASMNQT